MTESGAIVFCGNELERTGKILFVVQGEADYFSFSWNIWIASFGLALPRLSFMS